MGIKRTGVFTQKVLVNKTPTLFSLPANFRIDSIVAEKKGAATGNLKIGMGSTVEQPSPERVTLGGIAANGEGEGYVSIKLKGMEDPTVIRINAFESRESIISKLIFADYPGYDVGKGDDDGEVVFSVTTADTSSGTNSITIGNVGATTTGFTVDKGVDAVTAEYKLTVTNEVESDGTITVAGEEIEVTSEDHGSVGALAGVIAEHNFADWVAVQDGKVVNFTAKQPGAIAAVTFDGGDTTSAAATVSEEEKGVDAERATLTLAKFTKAAQEDGFLTLDLAGVVYVIPVEKDDDNEALQGLILDKKFVGWTVEEGASDDIKFISDSLGFDEDIYAEIYQGTDLNPDELKVDDAVDWVIGNEVVASVSMAGTSGTLIPITVKKGTFVKNKKSYLAASITNGAKVVLHISLEKYI